MRAYHYHPDFYCSDVSTHRVLPLPVWCGWRTLQSTTCMMSQERKPSILILTRFCLILKTPRPLDLKTISISYPSRKLPIYEYGEHSIDFWVSKDECKSFFVDENYKEGCDLLKYVFAPVDIEKTCRLSMSKQHWNLSRFVLLKNQSLTNSIQP